MQDYDEEELQQVINQAAFKDIPYAAANMLHYFTAIDNIEKSLDAWARKSLQAIEVKSYWHSRLRYAKALQAYAKNNLTQAEDILSSLASSSNIPENLLWKVQLQRARILFEQRKYYAADQIYKNTKFPPRIFGRVLLERAWAQYYLKDYSMSLGLLESLKTPALSYASDPEQYLLAMIIYREVCHYPKVALLSEEFKKRYQDTYTKILKNKNFHENFVLVWQKLNGQAYREKADVYDALYKEQQLWQDAKASYIKSEAGKYILSLIERKLQDFDLYLKRFMMEDLKSEANRFLEYWDYIKLADYVSKLDEYRIKPMFENRKYSINLEDKRSFNTLYWPVSGEYWKEEFPYYQVLLSDRCEMNESGGAK